MSDENDRLVSIHNQPVTPARLRQAAADAELRGDWTDAEMLKSAADKIINLEAQNQAFRHALAHGVSLNFISKRRWFHIRH